MSSSSRSSSPLDVPALAFGAVGAPRPPWLAAARRRRRLPPPPPRGGVVGAGDCAERTQAWVFFGNHFANEAFYNKTMAQGEPALSSASVSRAAARYSLRAWGLQSKRRLGDQTTTYVTRLPAGGARARTTSSS